MASPQTHPSQEVRLVTLERDVSGMKGDIGEIKSSMFAGFKDLGSKLESKGATNWNALGLGAMVLLAVLGWGWALFGNFQSRTNDDITGLKQMISAGIAEQKAAVVAMQADSKTSINALAVSQKAGDDALATELKASTDKFISRPDLLDKFATAKEKRDSQQAATDGRIARLEADLADAKKEIVPLGTHKEQWGHQAFVNDEVQKQIDDVRKKNDDLFNGRDAIQRLLLQVDRLNAKVLGESK